MSKIRIRPTFQKFSKFRKLFVRPASPRHNGKLHKLTIVGNRSHLRLLIPISQPIQYFGKNETNTVEKLLCSAKRYTKIVPSSHTRFFCVDIYPTI